jgi:two-component system, LytTR family, response regulator
MTNPITTIIIDDEQEARDLLESLLHKFPEIQVIQKLSNVDDAIKSFIKNKPMLVFLDVQMPQKDGFEFIHAIKEFDIKTCIVFITAYHQFAIEAIKHSAFDYLLKPVNQSDLQKTIERFRSKCEETDIKKNIDELLHQLQNHKKIKLFTRTGFELVNPENILYLEADGNYSYIYCVSGNKMTSTLNLGSIENILPKDNFFRISRTFIINTLHLSVVDRKHHICKLSANGAGHELTIAKDRVRLLEEFL